MPAITFKPRVKETSTTTGTGSITLAGAVVGYQSFDDAFVVTDDYFYYCIEAVDGNGVPTGQWEEGIGHLSASTTLVRDTLLSSSTGSAVSFSAGTKNVFCTAPAAFLNDGVVRVLSSTTITTNTGTKQNLYTVPTGKKCIVTAVSIRNASASFGGSGAVASCGFNGGANDWDVDSGLGYPFPDALLGLLTTSAKVITRPASVDEFAGAAMPSAIGAAGDVFGIIMTDGPSGTASVDTIGYLVDA